MPNADTGNLRVEHSLFVFKITRGYFFVSKIVENVLNRSYSIALQQIEIKTNIRNTVCGMYDAQVTHLCMGAYGEHCRNRTFCFIAKNCAINLNRKTKYTIT